MRSTFDFNDPTINPLIPINMLTNENKTAISGMYYDGYSVEEIAEFLELDEIEVLDFVDALDQIGAIYV